MQSAQLITSFADITIFDANNLTTEGKKLAELTQAGFPLLPGFIISSKAYMQFLMGNKLDKKITQLLTTIHYDYPETLLQIANHIKKMILDAPISPQLINELQAQYEQLALSSTTLKAYAHIPGFPLHATQRAQTFDEMLLKTKDIWASHFSATLLAKRNQQQLSQLQTGTTILVQQYYKPKKYGVAITCDPRDHTKDKLFIAHHNAENKDTYLISKKNLTILHRSLQNRPGITQLLSLPELLSIAKLSKALEKHTYFPQEIQWGFVDGKLFILSTKPFTSLPQTKPESLRKHALSRGYSLNNCIATGYVHKVLTEKDLQTIQSRHILVIKKLLPSHLPYIKQVRGVITEQGDKHSALTTQLRAMGKPILYDVAFATKGLANNTLITVHGKKGEIYKGSL